MKKILSFLITAIFLLNIASAVSIDSVSVDTLSPGSEGIIRIGIQNDFNDDAEDLSFVLNFANTPFIPIGSSEASLEELESDEDENFGFRIKASNSVSPGDYEVPYTLSYTLNSKPVTRSGSIGIKVSSQPSLTFTTSTENPIVGQKGTITLKIINSGFADARFVSIRVLPDGYNLLSESSVYIGSVDSDDFETATFDALFKSDDARFAGVLEYTDFDNKKISQNINLPLNVYTQEEALELGLIEKSNSLLYGIIIAILIVFWLIRRSLKKRARLKRSMANNGA